MTDHVLNRRAHKRLVLYIARSQQTTFMTDHCYM